MPGTVSCLTCRVCLSGFERHELQEAFLPCDKPTNSNATRAFALIAKKAPSFRAVDAGARRAKLALCYDTFAGTKTRVLSLEHQVCAVNPRAGHARIACRV